MQRITIIMLAMSALLIISIACYGQTIITPEQAIVAVRMFEGDGNLQPKCRPATQRSGEAEWEREWSYGLDSTDGNRTWSVNAATGEVTGAIYHDAFPAEQTDEPFGPLTQAQCLQIAENFARSRYADFGTMGFHSDWQEWSDNGWLFRWRQKTTYDAWTPSVVAVSVNPADGRVQMYTSRRVPTQVAQPPQATTDQAIGAVKAATGIVIVDGDPDPGLCADPGGLFWRMRVSGKDAEDRYHHCSASVNAITGEIAELVCDDDWGSLTVSKPSITTGDLISIRDLIAKVPAACIHWLGKDGARLFIGKNRYTLVPGKDTIEWTGGTIKLSAKIKLVGGRLMVPSGLIGVLKSAPVPKESPSTLTKSR